MEPVLELKMLGAAVIVGLVHLFWGSAAAQPQIGLKWNVGPRDEPRPLTGMAGRLQRAFANFRETFAFFVALLLAVVLSGKTGGLSAVGTMVYVAARAVYIPLYAFGVPVVRSIVWLISMVGLLMLLAALFV
ncbi:MAPEG family protein [Caulobacter segnis]|uniref:MAPEG family protein n=1 Tax=Caulobacter segnis TaxID=88688 RepID=UPI00240F7204|nr:MAPEG family protein [Caulobacter segnis]MDG2522844.1 MAPEG family protein [Caulobacter segnis]